MALVRPYRGPVYDCVAQLLSSLQDVTQGCLREDAAAGSKQLEKDIKDKASKAPALPDPFSADICFVSDPVRDCAFVGREAAKQRKLTRILGKAAMKHNRPPQNGGSSSLAARKEQAKESLQKAELRKDPSTKQKEKEKTNTQTVSPRSCTRAACDPAGGSVPLSVSTPARPATQAPQPSATSQSQKAMSSAMLECKGKEVKAKVVVPGTSSTNIAAAALQQQSSSTAATASTTGPPGRSVREMMKKFEANQQPVPNSTISASGAAEKSRIPPYPGRQGPGSVMAQVASREVTPVGSGTIPFKETASAVSVANSTGPQASEVPPVAAEPLPAIPIRPKGAASRARMRSGCLPAPTEQPASTEQPTSQEPEAPVPSAPDKVSAVPSEDVGQGVAKVASEDAAVEDPERPSSARTGGLKSLQQERDSKKTTSKPLAASNSSSSLLLRQTTPLSPKRDEDNYEISEKDANSDEEGEPDRSKKHVPRWCGFYLKELEAQSSWDPDSIFGSQVPRCDLNAVFTDELYKSCRKERPQRKRGSSQDWKKDRLRSAEVKDYKRKMGHVKPWTPSCKTPLGVHNTTVA